MKKPVKRAAPRKAPRDPLNVVDVIDNATGSLEAVVRLIDRQTLKLDRKHAERLYGLADRILMARRTVWLKAQYERDRLDGLVRSSMPVIVHAAPRPKRRPQAQTATIRSRIVTAKKPGRRDGDRR